MDSKQNAQFEQEKATEDTLTSRLNRLVERLPIVNGLSAVGRKRAVPLLLVLLLGICLMTFGSRGFPTADEPTAAAPAEEQPTASSAFSEEEQLEQKLAGIFSQIRGAGTVEVSLTFANDGVTEYAVNASTTVRSSEQTAADGGSEQTTETTGTDTVVFENNDAAPVVVTKSAPTVQGVVIVAAGADDPNVCTQLAQAAASLLDIPMHKVIVCTGGKEQ